MVGMFPRRGCLSANPEMLEAKAPWEKPVSLLDGFEGIWALVLAEIWGRLYLDRRGAPLE